jgi:hypothetical protein
VAAQLNIHLQYPVFTKIVWREFHESNIHGGAVIAKPLNTESNAHMRKRWCHDHKIWTSDNWKRMRDMVRWVTLHAGTYRKSLCLENTQGSRQSGMPSSNSKTRERFVMVWTAVSWYSILLVPLLLFMAELLQWSMWTGWVMRCTPWTRRYFRKTIQFSKMTMSPFTQVKLFIHDLKSMKVNFNMFLGQHNHQIWSSLDHFVQFWRLEWGTNSYLQHL